MTLKTGAISIYEQNYIHMNSRIVFSILGVFFTMISCQNQNKIILVEHSKSDYQIVISAMALQYEREAAFELQKVLEQISGVMIEVVTDADSASVSKYEILIGKSNRAEFENISSTVNQLNEDGFIIKTVDKKLIIAGGKEKGTMYGIYTFLEDYLGCRKYNAACTYIPKTERIALNQIDIKEEPAFEYRELHMPEVRKDSAFRDWHKLDIKDGINEWGMFVHTFDDFIPAEMYFEEHPEYFSFLNVKRIPDGQLCLSNPEVFELVANGLKERMKQKPKAKYWSVSQNDTYKACECEQCQEKYTKFGGHSGAMIDFVNNIASLFPEKIISTLAYQYTRSAPINITPAENVNIMFCSIECNRSRPISSDTLSESFRKDTEEWCKLTDNIFMWDYVVQFRNLLSPFPNLKVLQPNIRYFRDQGMQMMFQQGSGGLMSEFVELRTYIIAKLLWNPDIDVDKLIIDFVNGYYGPAGKYILQYIDKMHDALDKSGGNLGIYGYPFDAINTFLTPPLIKDYEEIFIKAREAVTDSPVYLERVSIAQLPLEFAILDISLRDVNDDLSYFNKQNETWSIREDMLQRLDEFTILAKKAGVTRYWEHGNYPDDYKATVERFVNSSMQNHLALNKTISLFTESSPKYPVGESAALCDGLKGINDYHFNWLGFEGPDMVVVIDLEEIMEIKSIELDFLQEIKSWIFLPEEVNFYSSTDMENYTLAGSILNEIPENRKSTFIETFKIEFNPIKCRYVKVVAKNRVMCPQWHPGAGYPAWIFCDEIIIW